MPVEVCVFTFTAILPSLPPVRWKTSRITRPAAVGEALPRSMEKLTTGQPITIVTTGDSVTAGSWVELCSRVGQLDEPDYTAKHDNARYSFAVLTADLLHAQIHLTAQGGLALLDGSGYYENGDVGMETAYDKLRYQPAAGRLTPWDFSRYIPDYVICAIGQNDHRVGGVENVMPDTDAQERWIGTYCRLLTDLMRKYPQAHFILTLTVLMHEEIWEEMADTVCARMAGGRVHRLRFARSGRATPGHPRIPEQCEMAYELTRFIQTLIPSS